VSSAKVIASLGEKLVETILIKREGALEYIRRDIIYLFLSVLQYTCNRKTTL